MLALFAWPVSTVHAQSDPYGELDQVYLDSVVARAGEDISIGIYARNDESLGSLSIPLIFNPAKLTLKDISFENSRVGYIATKIVNPSDMVTPEGKFTVAVIRLLEKAVPPGDGLIFTAVFTVSPDVQPGDVYQIDSTFIPPAGELLLVEAEGAGKIYPGFTAGKIVIRGANHAPVFSRLDDQSGFEGDTISLLVSVSDLDNDSLKLNLIDKPLGAHFVDNRDGTGLFTWVPSYVGPNSSDGSPFTAAFRATDGSLAIESEVQLQVINRNRAPILTLPDSVEVPAGQELVFDVSAIDPDFEDIIWEMTSDFPGASLTGGNPGTFHWTSHITDTGSGDIEFTATDPFGLSTSATVHATIGAATLYGLRLDSLESFPNEEIEFEIRLDNKLPVNGFSLLISYDPTGLTYLGATSESTRAEGFEKFTVASNYNGVSGDLFVEGKVSIAGGVSLASGDGPVAILKFRTTGDLEFAGLGIPVKFKFINGAPFIHNVLLDTVETLVESNAISFVNGLVKIHDIGDVNIGDINLNGLAAEISDVIYFTNHFIEPLKYPFDALQYANSDVNRDGLAATIADLVTLIRIIVEGSSPAPKLDDLETSGVALHVEHQEERVAIQYDAETDIAGVRFVFDCTRELKYENIQLLQDNMVLDFGQQGSVVNVVVYSWDNEVMPSGHQPLLSIEGIDNIEFDVVELADADGQLLALSAPSPGETELLPRDYSLEQNYPNPFNPETVIGFSLPRADNVALSIYNVLGRQVRTLLEEGLPAGRHEIVWDGRDQQGQDVASGVYLYRLTYTDGSVTKKMLLLK